MTIQQEGFGLILNLEALGWIGGIIAIVATFIWEAVGKKFKPWSWLLNWIGKRINATMTTRLDTIDERLNKLEAADQQQDARNAEQRALDARRHIIAAADEIRRHIDHSEEWFNSVLEDATAYERYCLSNPDFKNEKATASIAILKEVYHDCFTNNKFL